MCIITDFTVDRHEHWLSVGEGLVLRHDYHQLWPTHPYLDRARNGDVFYVRIAICKTHIN